LTTCFFVSDLHGKMERYAKLFDAIYHEAPAALFLGGDLFPSGIAMLTSSKSENLDFANDFLIPEFSRLKHSMADKYPKIFLILGNDDGRFEEKIILGAAELGLWDYIHHRKANLRDWPVYGYSYIPPSPFMLKDWERYDVSRYVDPGCIAPEEGMHSIKTAEYEDRYATIEKDLNLLTNSENLEKAIILFHSPPYDSRLDRAALDGKMIDYVPMDIHIGSIAVRRFIEAKQPLITLHGHVHESARITGSWQESFGRTHAFSAAHDGPELALICFALENLDGATRRLL
jgi:Icc-related predicted phosphoesterase